MGRNDTYEIWNYMCRRHREMCIRDSHWCHVMAHESFEDFDVAKLLNENFISIKVDREERPDRCV